MQTVPFNPEHALAGRPTRYGKGPFVRVAQLNYSSEGFIVSAHYIDPNGRLRSDLRTSDNFCHPADPTWDSEPGQTKPVTPKPNLHSADWQPIATAPKDGRFVLIAGPSGYTSTPLRVEVCQFEADCQHWRNHAHDWFSDSGHGDPLYWLGLPEIP